MSKNISILVFAIIAVLALSVACKHQGAVSTWTGTVSDSMCKADHSMMGEQGKDPAACARACVDGGQKFVLVESSTGKVFSLDDQAKARELAGQKVTIEGHLEGDTIHVSRLEAAGS